MLKKRKKERKRKMQNVSKFIFFLVIFFSVVLFLYWNQDQKNDHCELVKIGNAFDVGEIC